MTDPAGKVFSYAYDATGNLSSVTFLDGTDNPVRTYAYNEPANTSGANLPTHLTGIIDENGNRFTTYQYAADGRAISTERSGGVSRYSVAYDGDGTSTVTDPLNTARIFGSQTIQDVPRHTSVDQPCDYCGLASSISYDSSGYLSGATNFNGIAFTYVHDARGLETSRTEASGTPQARTIDTEWHATFRLPTRITERDSGGAVLRETAMSHDAAGNVLSRTITAGSSSRTWTYTYNANGSVLSANGPVGDITTYSYYASDDPDPGKRGNLASVTNAVVHTTLITAYNAHGQPLTIVDPNGLTTTLAYDERLRLTSRSVGGELTSYQYDGVGQLTKVTLPDGSFLAYTYDAAHRLTAITDALGNKISYSLDGMGNRIQEQVLDPLGALAQTRSRVFNSLNRLFQEIGAQSQTTQYAYDNQGNVTSVDGPLSGTVDVTTNAYDALNRLVRVTDPNSGQVDYGYNALDQLASVSDPRSLVTSYAYNGLGDLNQQVSPDTGTTTNTYDSGGNLATSADAKGQVTTYAYDALNRVTRITFPDGTRHDYLYDQGTNGIGRLSGITETDSGSQVTSQIAYTYDAHGRVTSETRTLGAIAYVAAYSYDSFGRMSGMTYPSGRTVSYAFDALGRVSQVSTEKDSQSQVVVQNVSYHPFGGVTGFAFGNGQVYSRSVDQDGRIASYSLGAQSYGIGYDAASRISFISELGNPPNSNTYGYDALDRLTSAVLPSTNFAYSYDPVGNRLTKTIGASTDAYAYESASNRISSVTPASAAPRNFSFDANGSTVADGLNTYAYDARGRMVQSVSSLGTTSYQVNALGQRVRKTNSLGDTVFHYDTRGRLIAETDPGGGMKREFIYLGDIPVGVVQ
jgi:YD repeat-containing protein